MSTKTTPRIRLNSWTHPTTGRERRYVGNLLEVLGIEVTYYQSGYVSSAYFEGHRLANSEAMRLRSVKVWLDEDDEIHVSSGTKQWTEDEIRDRVHEALTGEEN